MSQTSSLDGLDWGILDTIGHEQPPIHPHLPTRYQPNTVPPPNQYQQQQQVIVPNIAHHHQQQVQVPNITHKHQQQQQQYKFIPRPPPDHIQQPQTISNHARPHTQTYNTIQIPRPQIIAQPHTPNRSQTQRPPQYTPHPAPSPRPPQHPHQFIQRTPTAQRSPLPQPSCSTAIRPRPTPAQHPVVIPLQRPHVSIPKLATIPTPVPARAHIPVPVPAPAPNRTLDSENFDEFPDMDLDWSVVDRAAEVRSNGLSAIPTDIPRHSAPVLTTNPAGNNTELRSDASSSSRKPSNFSAYFQPPGQQAVQTWKQIMTPPVDVNGRPKPPSSGANSAKLPQSSKGPTLGPRSTYTLPPPKDPNRQTTISEYREVFPSVETSPMTDEQRLAEDGPCDTSELPHEVDQKALKSWVYPTNMPERLYQFTITHCALFHNTLVCLPTGLGKTFIAAVVIYNYWRWFPKGKIIFMAPTKPLVSQQVKACQQIVGIPQGQMDIITGAAAPHTRLKVWETKRIFFCTPQTFKNDLATRCDARQIVLLVFDEAHRAQRNYAYVEAYAQVMTHNPHFRVLGLSATPGTNMDAVQKVVTNLGIQRIEYRSEDSPDIVPYSHKKCITEIVVELSDEVNRLAKVVMNWLFRPVLETLKKGGALAERYGSAEDMTPFRIHSLRQDFRSKGKDGGLNWNLEAEFGMAQSLAYAYDLLLRHGICPFYQFINELLIEDDPKHQKLIALIKKSKHFKPVFDALPGRMLEPTFSSHPKIDRLLNMILSHFAESHADTKVMIFAEMRNSAAHIADVLAKHSPTVRPSLFLGQKKVGGLGQGQKEQLEVVKRFRENVINTLVCTSIGEEGLDIGSVDLIICYDASASPIRMLQRMGRAGRKRAGGSVILLIPGRETNMYARGAEKGKAITRGIKANKMVMAASACAYAGRMIPPTAKTHCRKESLTVAQWVDTEQLIIPNRGVRKVDYGVSLSSKSWWQIAPTTIYRVPHGQASAELVNNMLILADIADQCPPNITRIARSLVPQATRQSSVETGEDAESDGEELPSVTGHVSADPTEDFILATQMPPRGLRVQSSDLESDLFVDENVDMTNIGPDDVCDDLFDASPVLVSKSGVCSPASNKRRFEFHTSSRHQKIAKR